MARKYYLIRNNKNPLSNRISFDILLQMFFTTYQDLYIKGYFQEAFGIDCVDGYISGTLGFNIDGVILKNLRKVNLWPIREKYIIYTEDDLFDIIEFLYDNVSLPLKGNYHS